MASEIGQWFGSGQLSAVSYQLVFASLNADRLIPVYAASLHHDAEAWGS